MENPLVAYLKSNKLRAPEIVKSSGGKIGATTIGYLMMGEGIGTRASTLITLEKVSGGAVKATDMLKYIEWLMSQRGHEEVFEE